MCIRDSEKHRSFRPRGAREAHRPRQAARARPRGARACLGGIGKRPRKEMLARIRPHDQARMFAAPTAHRPAAHNEPSTIWATTSRGREWGAGARPSQKAGLFAYSNALCGVFIKLARLNNIFSLFDFGQGTYRAHSLSFPLTSQRLMAHGPSPQAQEKP